MSIQQFVVDAFTAERFTGNPAAVCVLPHWPDAALLQAIAAENNLSETAFIVSAGADFDLRWFTPVTEVDLCGHATLAAAHVLFNHLDFAGSQISFNTRSGTLTVQRNGDRLAMSFPASVPQPCVPPVELVSALGGRPVAILAAEDYLVVYEDATFVQALQPDLTLLAKLDRRGVIVSAPGTDRDFVSRFFGPRVGIDEDPVTGSAHCQLAPYWAARLGKTALQARQVSARGGDVHCVLEGDRVILSGTAVTFLQGMLNIEL